MSALSDPAHYREVVLRLTAFENAPMTVTPMFSEAVPQPIPTIASNEVLEVLSRKATRQLTFDDRKLLGDVLFPGDLWGQFERWSTDATEKGEGVRIVVELSDDSYLVQVPWEAAFINSAPLWQADARSIVRRLIGMSEEGPMPTSPALQVGLLDASHADTHRDLRLTQPAREVFTTRSVSTMSGLRDWAESEPRGALDILHVQGHGVEDPPSMIIVQSDGRPGESVKVKTLAATIRKLSPTLVVLVTCGSASDATGTGSLVQWMAEDVDGTVGFRDAISVEDADRFSQAFYDVILAGGSIDAAMRRGRESMLRFSDAIAQVYLKRRGSSRLVAAPALEVVSVTEVTAADVELPIFVRSGNDVAGLWADDNRVLGDGARLDDLFVPRVDRPGSLAVAPDGRIAAVLDRDRVSAVWVSAPLGDIRRTPIAWAHDIALPEELSGRDARLLTVAILRTGMMRLVIAADDQVWRIFLGRDGWGRHEPLLTRTAKVVAGIDTRNGLLLVDDRGRRVLEPTVQVFRGNFAIDHLDISTRGGRSLAVALGSKNGRTKERMFVASQQNDRGAWIAVDLERAFESLKDAPTGGEPPIIQAATVFRELDDAASPSTIALVFDDEPHTLSIDVSSAPKRRAVPRGRQ